MILIKTSDLETHLHAHQRTSTHEFRLTAKRSTLGSAVIDPTTTNAEASSFIADFSLEHSYPGETVTAAMKA